MAWPPDPADIGNENRLTSSPEGCEKERPTGLPAAPTGNLPLAFWQEDLADGAAGATPRWDGSEHGLWALLSGIPDPEIPVISLVDLGIVRSVRMEGTGGSVTVVITPTYAGCPATESIEREIRRVLAAAGVAAPCVERQLAPPWTTDWISAAGRAALQRHGIVPPCATAHATTQALRFVPACPRCGAHRTERISEFGATPCKALYRCLECREPFDYFKPL